MGNRKTPEEVYKIDGENPVYCMFTLDEARMFFMRGDMQFEPLLNSRGREIILREGCSIVKPYEFLGKSRLLKRIYVPGITLELSLTKLGESQFPEELAEENAFAAEDPKTFKPTKPDWGNAQFNSVYHDRVRLYESRYLAEDIDKRNFQLRVLDKLIYCWVSEALKNL